MNRIVGNDSNQNVRSFASHRCDESYVELCALSTTNTLTAEEWQKLELHLSNCTRCRELIAQYERVVATMLPALAVEQPQIYGDDLSGPWSVERAETTLMARIERENILPEEIPPKTTIESSKRSLPWTILGAAIFLGILLWTGYRVGDIRGKRSSTVALVRTIRSGNPQPSSDPVVPTSSELIKKANRERSAEVSDLRRQLQENLLEVAKLKQEQNGLQQELQQRNANLDRSSSAQADLERQLSLARSNAKDLQEKLVSAENQPPRDASQVAKLQVRVRELGDALQSKDQEIAQREELLQHDQDIRNLMGARDLYIAEIYDVAKTGVTQKPFGRVFYTRGKSLVFYAYDLDQQSGTQRVNTFQAWGRRDVDQQKDINLGIFYQDEQNKKRWVLKSNDPTTLAQIDAVFVTVEPNGESAKPTGKPLLFTYLRMTPNHP